MKRRAFFKGVAAAAAAAPLLPDVAAGLVERLGTLGRDVASASSERALWQRLRREFRLHPGLVHLNCGSIGATPRVVTDALTAYLAELEGNPLANTWGGLGSEMEQVRAKGAEFIGAELDEIVALTRNTTEGMKPRSQRPRPPAGRRGADDESRARRRHGLLAALGAHPRRGGSLHQNAQSRARCRPDFATGGGSPDAAHPRVQLLPHRHHHRVANAAGGHRRPHPAPRHPAGLRRRAGPRHDRRRRQSARRRYLCFQQPQVDARAQGHGDCSTSARKCKIASGPCSRIPVTAPIPPRPAPATYRRSSRTG